LWTFYGEWLEDLLVKRGPHQFERRPGARLRVSSGFVSFFNQAAEFSDALWPDGATDAEFSFTLRPHFTESIRRVTVNVDGQPREFSPTDVARGIFRWYGPDAQFVRVSGQVMGREEELRRFTGTWAVFRLFQEGNWQTSTANPSVHTVRWRWPLQDQYVTLEAELNLAGTPPILKRDYFNTVRSCVSRIVQ
jgi:type VI protein secretion system component VasK